MTIAFRAKSEDGNYNIAGTGSITVLRPVGAVAGDLMVVALNALAQASVINPPAGWTTVRKVGSLGVFVKSCASDEPASWVFGLGVTRTQYWAWACVAYSGASVDAPLVNVEAGGTFASTIQAQTVPAITPTSAPTMLLGIVSGRQGAIWNIDPPVSMTQRAEAAASGANNYGLTVAEQAWATAVATGSRVFTGVGDQFTGAFGGDYEFLALSPVPPPTVVGCQPAYGGILGGTVLTLTGTKFKAGATVTVKGVAATDVTVVSDTVITCTTGPGTAGRGDVVVTTTDGSGTMVNGFTYFDVKDSSVKLVKAGSVAGNNYADATVQWPSADAVKSYGGANDMWGTTLTPADVNDPAFGVAVSAVVTAGQARVDAVRVTVHYSVPGVADPSTFLSVLRVAGDKRTSRPEIYRLPRSGLTVANDPNIPKERDSAQLLTSRYVRPARVIEKTYREYQVWLDATPAGNTPGLQVWAALNDGPAIQLLNSAGAAATLRATGRYRLFFPARSIGSYVQLQFVVPPKSGDEVDVAISLREGILYGQYRLLSKSVISAVFILGPGEFEDHTSMRRESPSQRAALEALAYRVVPYKSPWGEEGYLEVIGMSFKEYRFKTPESLAWVATLKMRTFPYE